MYTVNDRLNALDVYLKIQNFKGAFIREGRLIKRGVYFKMHKFRKEKETSSWTCSNRTIAAKICRSERVWENGESVIRQAARKEREIQPCLMTF